MFSSIHLKKNILTSGDLVLLASGSAVPADCIVNHGNIEVDQAALTGESLPVSMHKGKMLISNISSFYCLYNAEYGQ